MKLGANAATGLGIALGLASIAAVALWSPAPTPAETIAAGQAAPERDVIVALDSESPQEIVHLRPDSDIEDELGQPVRQVVQVDRGDTLLDLLVRVGVSSAEAHEAIGALRKVYNPRHLRAGQEVTVSFARPSDGLGAGVFQAISLTPKRAARFSPNAPRKGSSPPTSKCRRPGASSTSRASSGPASSRRPERLACPRLRRSRWFAQCPMTSTSSATSSPKTASRC